MYVNITGTPNNKDVYIYQSFHKENGTLQSENGRVSVVFSQGAHIAKDEQRLFNTQVYSRFSALYLSKMGILCIFPY